jgi:hypothetical protein
MNSNIDENTKTKHDMADDATPTANADQLYNDLVTAIKDGDGYIEAWRSFEEVAPDDDAESSLKNLLIESWKKDVYTTRIFEIMKACGEFGAKLLNDVVEAREKDGKLDNAILKKIIATEIPLNRDFLDTLLLRVENQTSELLDIQVLLESLRTQ